jgi:hypothetical protein
MNLEREINRVNINLLTSVTQLKGERERERERERTMSNLKNQARESALPRLT